jgi:hypothetical protein
MRSLQEASMRRLIESLTPVDRDLYWRWVGAMFAFYVVLMVGAAGVFMNHESSRNLAHEGAATVAMDRKHPAFERASIPIQQAARYE